MNSNPLAYSFAQRTVSPLSGNTLKPTTMPSLPALASSLNPYASPNTSATSLYTATGGGPQSLSQLTMSILQLLTGLLSQIMSGQNSGYTGGNSQAIPGSNSGNAGNAGKAGNSPNAGNVGNAGDAANFSPDDSHSSPTPSPSPGNSSTDGVEFGVNGHPTWGGSSYEKLTPDQQMQKVKSLGMSTYAIDFNSGNAAQDQQLLDAAKRNGVNVQVNMGVDRNQFSGYDDAYQAALKEGAAVGKQVNGQAKYFQLDNELDQFVDPSGTGQIDPQKYQVALGIIKGLNDGLKSTDPNAQTIVNTTEAPSGIAFLKQLQKDGADWDVTGYHWYSGTGTDINTTGSTQNGGGTTLQNVHDLGKPIWITEFNGSPSGAQGPSANRSQNAQIVANEIQGIKQNAQKYNIIGANVHELMDEPERNSSEAKYGVLDGNGNDTATSQAIREALS